MEDFNLFTFPHEAKIERFNISSNLFEPVYVNVKIDVQSVPRSYNLFFPFIIDTFFTVRELMFQSTEDIRVGDRVTITKGLTSPTSTKEIQQYIIKDVSDFSGDADMNYIQCKGGHNTLLSDHRTEEIKRVKKQKDTNYDPILNESYGVDTTVTESFTANVVQSIRISKYSNNADFGMFKDAQYDAIIDTSVSSLILDPIKIDDIFEYNGEKYKVKYVYHMPNPIKIVMVGLTSLNNKTK